MISYYKYQNIIMLDVDYLLDKWSRMGWKQKIGVFQRTVIECCVLLVVSVMFFWGTLFTLWIFTLLVGPDPYIQQFIPTYHLQTLKDTSLVTVFINEQYKEAICSQQPEDPHYFNQLTITYNQLCNIQQNKLPQMSNKAEVRYRKVDYQSVKYVSGCLKYRKKQMSCLRYLARQSMVIFRDIDLNNLEYLYMQLQLNEKNLVPVEGTIIEFEQDCWLVIKLFKDHYHIFTLIYTYGITILLTISVILIRIFILARNLISQQKQRALKEQRQKLMKLNEQQKNGKNGIGSNQKAMVLEKDKNV